MTSDDIDWDQLPCCGNCRFYRGPVPVQKYLSHKDEPGNQPWFCMHPDNAGETFTCPIEDCSHFQPNTFGCVIDPKARTHYWITEGHEGLGLEDDDGRWPF